MKYSVADAAKLVGKTRQTIYRHIESKPISIEKDEDGNSFIDASELVRVYGNSINFNALNDKSDKKDTVTKSQDVTDQDSQIELKVVQEQLKSAEMQVEIIQSQMGREREMLEGQVDRLSAALEKAQDGYNNVTLLLEDHHTKDSGSQEWERAVKALESRISNQEAAAERRREREAKVLRQNKALKRALDAERKKSLLQKLFGLK